MPAARMVIPGLRKWLRETPQPFKLRCGDTTIRIDSTARKWITAEESIVAINPSEVQALTSDGEVLRVFRIREDLAEKAESQKESWPDAPEAQMAQIITAACDRAASRHENAYKLAFDKLSQMFEAQSLRLEEQMRVNAALQSELLRLKVKTQTVYVEPEDTDPNGALVQTVLTGAVQKMFLESGAPQTNGKAKQ